jgi:hypothetical protein
MRLLRRRGGGGDAGAGAGAGPGSGRGARGQLLALLRFAVVAAVLYVLARAAAFAGGDAHARSPPPPPFEWHGAALMDWEISPPSAPRAPRAPPAPPAPRAPPHNVSLSRASADALPHASASSNGSSSSAMNTRPPAPPPRIVFATFATASVFDFLRNWAASVAAIGVPASHVRIAALDDATAALCAAHGLNCSRDADATADGFGGVATGGAALPGVVARRRRTTRRRRRALLRAAPAARRLADAASFRAVGRAKAAFLAALLAEEAASGAPAAVLMSDVDTVWLSDPRAWLSEDAAVAAADVAVANDCVSAAEDARRGGCTAGAFNTGVVLARPSGAGRALVAAWRDGFATPAHAHEHDQGLFNRLVRGDDGKRLVRLSPFLFRAAHDASGAQLAALPVAAFAGGHTFWVQAAHARPPRPGLAPPPPRPFVVHATFTFSHALGKRQRFRESRLWAVDPPSYYASPDARYITYDTAHASNDAAAHAALPGGGGVGAHFRAAAWHRAALASALALGRALNRTLILPRLRCFCDRWWGDVLPGCVMPGADVALPFICPMDHLFFLPNWEGRFAYREAGFLEHPAVPEAVRASSMRVLVTHDGARRRVCAGARVRVHVCALTFARVCLALRLAAAGRGRGAARAAARVQHRRRRRGGAGGARGDARAHAGEPCTGILSIRGRRRLEGLRCRAGRRAHRRCLVLRPHPRSPPARRAAPQLHRRLPAPAAAAARCGLRCARGIRP